MSAGGQFLGHPYQRTRCVRISIEGLSNASRDRQGRGMAHSFVEFESVRDSMNYSRNPSNQSDPETQPEWPEQYAYTSNASSRTWTERSPPRSEYRDERLDPPDMRTRSRPASINPWLFVMATALNTMVAAVLAVIITLGVVRQERTDSQHAELAATSVSSSSKAVAGVESTQLTTAPQAIELRSIGSPNQPLQLELQKPAPLPLQIKPEGAAHQPFILVLNGLPVGTVLSGAVQIGSDSWYLTPDSASQITIALPEWSTSVFEITVTLRRTNGMIAAQSKAWIAVPPPASLEAAGPPKMEDSKVRELMAKADRLLENGDIIAARAMYQRAAELGSGPAALTLGATYDPNRLWSLGVVGMVGNKERAKQWYSRASELGQPEGKARLMLLRN